MVHVTAHAIDRYRERVAKVTKKAARLALSSPAVEKAVEFGAHFVRLPTRHRIVLDGDTVVTVLPDETHPNTLSIAADRKHGRS